MNNNYSAHDFRVEETMILLYVSNQTSQKNQNNIENNIKVSNRNTTDLDTEICQSNFYCYKQKIL